MNAMIATTFVIASLWIIVGIVVFRWTYRLLHTKSRAGLLRSIGVWTTCTTAFLLFSLIGYGFLRTHLALQLFIIEGGSMLPTYHTGDLALINASSEDLSRGDIVVYDTPQNPGHFYVSRIVGIPSEHLEIKQGDVFINGHVLDETAYWSDESVTQGQINIALTGDQYFVLGDNRGTAIDSRIQGPISRTRILGKIFRGN